MAFSKTIQMYIFEGNPNGRIMCELSNWNGRIYKISRNELSEFAKRKDSENTGVYFLFGKDESNFDTVYVGEAEKMFTRLKQHLKEDYWNDCIAVISKDNLLNKAHVKYLENKFYNIAQDTGRANVLNSTIPTCSSISEYDEEMCIRDRIKTGLYNMQVAPMIISFTTIAKTNMPIRLVFASKYIY